MQLEEAQQRMLALVEPLESETVEIATARDRYLAVNLHARRSQPPADLSAMDGYAMGADDLSGPWTLVGESAAGHPFEGVLESGETVRISTGAAVPAGAGAVLLQENAARTGDRISLTNDDGPTPRHIRRKGFDFRTGDLLFAAGQRIGPAQLALAIAGGHGKLAVGSLPGIAILDSGDELVAEPDKASGLQIPASNGPMLAALAASHCRDCQRLGPVPDRLDAMVAALEQASGADVIVTSGGASVGDHDLVRPALEQWGAEIDFWRIAIKPGKPLMVARKGRQVILGLPGNPVSSYVTAFLFLLPVLRKLAGAVEPLPPRDRQTLAGALPATGARAEFVRATVQDGSVRPLDETDSSALLALSRAEALIWRPPNAAAAQDGEEVGVYRL